MTKETKLLLEIAGWIVEWEIESKDDSQFNSHTDNIKQLVRAILKEQIKEAESAPQESQFCMVECTDNLLKGVSK